MLPGLAPGATIVRDNLSVHRSPAVRAAVEAAGRRLRYLPAYSPDLNPIEQAFAKLKAYRRGVAARAYEPLVAAIGVGLSRITPIDVAGFDRDCGYHLPCQRRNHHEIRSRSREGRTKTEQLTSSRIFSHCFSYFALDTCLTQGKPGIDLKINQWYGLLALKNTYDPTNPFRADHNIAPTDS